MRPYDLVVGGLVVLSALLPNACVASAWDEDPGIYRRPESDLWKLDDPRWPEQRLRLCSQLDQAERALADARTRYTDEHPRIQLTKRRIEELKREAGDCSLKNEPIRPPSI